MFSYLHNLFTLTESTAKDALFVAWLVILVITAVVTRLSLKAIVSVIVVGMIVMGVANNSDLVKGGGDKTVKEIKNGTTNGLPAPLHQPRPAPTTNPAAAVSTAVRAV
ncbi:MAG: hypothetical protein DLM61_23780 [Pseudonocardiales bacterium]|nr:MAG: hypothetical protein DLM61_23780 [Pseudonocardiales bacterium]